MNFFSLFSLSGSLSLVIPGSSFTASLNGTYQLCGTDANGCVNCSDTLVFVNLGVGEALSGAFGIYPNPAEDSFTLMFSNTADNRILQIFDSAGRLMDSMVLPVSDRFTYSGRFPGGVYTVVVEENGSRTFRRLVVR